MKTRHSSGVLTGIVTHNGCVPGHWSASAAVDTPAALGSHRRIFVTRVAQSPVHADTASHPNSTTCARIMGDGAW